MDVTAIHIVIEDDKRERATITLYADKLYQGITTERAAQQIALRIARLINGKIVAMSQTTPITLPVEVGADSINSDIEERSRFVLLFENGIKGGLSIPTFSETYYFAHSRIVDVGYEFVSDFIDNLVVGAGVTIDAVAAGSATVRFTDRHNSPLDAVVSGKETFTRSERL